MFTAPFTAEEKKFIRLAANLDDIEVAAALIMAEGFAHGMEEAQAAQAVVDFLELNGRSRQAASVRERFLGEP